MLRRGRWFHNWFDSSRIAQKKTPVRKSNKVPLLKVDYGRLEEKKMRCQLKPLGIKFSVWGNTEHKMLPRNSLLQQHFCKERWSLAKISSVRQHNFCETLWEGGRGQHFTFTERKISMSTWARGPSPLCLTNDKLSQKSKFHQIICAHLSNFIWTSFWFPTFLRNQAAFSFLFVASEAQSTTANG